MNGIRDSKDRVWRLAVNINAVKEFEQRTEIKVFARMFELWKKNRASGNDVFETMLSIIAELFPGIEEAAAFCYACGRVEGEAVKPSFDEFCETVDLLECGKAIVMLTERLQEFMPDKPELKKGKGGGNPLEQ